MSAAALMPAFELHELGPETETVAEETVDSAVAMDAPTAKEKLLAAMAESEEGRALVPLVEALKPTSCRGLTLQLGYDEAISAEDLVRLTAKETERLLQQAMQAAFNTGQARVLVRRWLAGLSDDQRPGLRPANEEEHQRTRARPLVQQVLDLFGGEVIDVRVNDRAQESGK
jgi:hypothetical protein